MPESSGGGWAWDVSLVVSSMSTSARAEFRRELTRARLAQTDDIMRAHPGRHGRLVELAAAMAQRTAMHDQLDSLLADATIERDVQ